MLRRTAVDSHQYVEGNRTFPRLWRIVNDIDMRHMPNIGVEVGVDEQGAFVQAIMWRPDTITGGMGTGCGGKIHIHEAQSDSSIVRTIIARFMAYYEHEVREAFHYKGKRIYGPHIDVEALLEVADRLEEPPS